MEEKNEKGKNIVIGILIGIICCLVIAIIFICYNKFIIKDNTNTNNSNNTSENNKPTEQENNIDYSGKFEKNGSDITITKNNEGYDIEIEIFRIGTFKGKTININNDKLTIVATAEKENDLEFEFDYNTKILTVTKSSWNLLSIGNTYQLDSNNDTITLEEIKNRFEVKSQGAGQNGTYYESIYDKEKQKIIISNLREMDQSTLYFLINNGKGYIYIENVNCFDHNILNSRLYDLNGKIIFNIPDKTMFSLILKDGEFRYGQTNYFEVDGAYYSENGVINKYNLDASKVSSSEKYDEVIEVGQKYSLIYNKNDNSIYVISNDGTYSKKIVEKSTYYYSFYYNTKDNEISVYLSRITCGDGPADRYILKLNDNTLTFERNT